jgi:hypothetical protein
MQGYKPFITKMTFTQEFKGNINQSKAISNPERQKRMEAAEKQDREKAERMRKIMNGPKF